MNHVYAMKGVGVMAKRTRKEAIRKELKKKDALASQKEEVKEEMVTVPEEDYPEIAKVLRDPNKKGYVASAMWIVFSGADNAYELDDAVDAGSNFGELLTDVNDYLKDLD